jgi:DNA-binding CsgD family transcriptional regulator
MVAVAERSWSPALEVLAPALRSGEDIGYREPGMFRIHPDAIEAMCGVGDVTGARELAALLRARAHLPWTQAAAAFTEGLVLAAEGSLDQAAEQILRAAGEFDALAHPSETGRALILLASIRRRQRRRGDASRILDQAALLLDTHGIRLWQGRLEGERLLLGGVHEGDEEDLTPAERRTAAAVSRGLTNRQIASDLNVSVKTVEAQLTRIYEKLGVHSRSQLVAALLGKKT